MENLRYLLVAIVGLTLIMSVVSGVNPSYFAGLNAFAEEHEEEEEDDDHSGSDEEESEDNDGSDEDDDEHDDESEEEDDDDEHEEDDDNKGKDKDDELEQSLGENSKVKLEVDDDHVDLEVEIEDGDLDDGQYDIVFACTSPDVNEEFTDALDVEDGEGEFETEMNLGEGTYTGCEVEVGGLSAEFESFTVTPEEEDDDDEHEEDDERDDKEREHEKEREREKKFESKLKTEDDGVEIEVEIEGLNMTDGSYDAIFACEEPELSITLDDAFEVEDGKGKLEETIGLANGTYSGCELSVEGDEIASFDTFTVSEDDKEKQEHRVEEKRKEKRERIVNTINGTTIHQRHINANPASPGEYEPDWNYTLVAAGLGHSDEDETDVALDADLSVWKSNRALILLDVLGGTVEAGNQTFTVKFGYAIYSLNHDAMRMAALAVDDDGNIFKLRLSGTAVDEDDEFPMESGSIDITFEGSSGPSHNRFGDWELTLDGTVSAS
jgi:hypothetical protein